LPVQKFWPKLMYCLQFILKFTSAGPFHLVLVHYRLWYSHHRLHAFLLKSSQLIIKQKVQMHGCMWLLWSMWIHLV